MTMEDRSLSPLEESQPRSGRSGHPPDLGGLSRRVAALEGDNAELRKTNADLVEFASLAAHELRSPLQTVTGYAELLGTEVGDALSDDGRKYLERLLQSASRMQDLVDALLVYARLGTKVRQRTDVDCARLAAETCEDLASIIQAAGAIVECDDLPVVVGDPLELALVFKNLLSNAIKYRRPGTPVGVRFSAASAEGEWHFSVDDNGVGIDERHRERVFRVFQRIPGQPVHEGTGIGLAACKRVIEGHGGRIWVEGNEPSGTRVCFTLPVPVCWSPF